MALDVIDCIDDPRISHCKAHVNGRTYRELFVSYTQAFLASLIIN